MRMFLAPLVVVALSGCGAEVTEATCAPICEQMAVSTEAPAVKAAGEATASAGGTSLSSFEQQLLDPLLADIREGIRPFADEAVGICKGQGKECTEFVGLEVGELPKGEYMVRAELRVPEVGEKETWKVRLETACKVTREGPSGPVTSESSNTREYDVRYAGKDRGYRLSPLYAIESPSKGGARDCTWKLVSPRPDGDKVIAEGSWKTPEA